MSDNHTPGLGMCTAFGCPRFGTMSADTLGSGRWYCGAHFAGAASSNDAKTQIMRRDQVMPIVESINDIRACYGTPAWENGTKVAISKRLKAIDRADLLPNDLDVGIQGWLLRLELTVERLTLDAGQQSFVEPPKTVGIDGPTHAAEFLPYAEEA
ncbi:conserved protein of unknown function [Pararobbsia alpina]|uniref:hypothetical protein n=1 Tax=Pararobbsia alpina TaxID=621374 RepID=UPI0039A6B294